MAELDLFEAPAPRLAERIRAADPDAIVIEVAGEPQGKGRPRAVIRKGKFGGQFVGTYTPDKTRNYETTLSLAAQDAMDGRPPFEGAVEVEFTARFSIPQSFSKKKRAAALAGRLLPTRVPDCDNLLKCCDGLNKIVWLDDKQIAVARVAKIYSERPGITIRVTPIGAGQG